MLVREKRWICETAVDVHDLQTPGPPVQSHLYHLYCVTADGRSHDETLLVTVANKYQAQ